MRGLCCECLQLVLDGQDPRDYVDEHGTAGAADEVVGQPGPGLPKEPDDNRPGHGSQCHDDQWRHCAVRFRTNHATPTAAMKLTASNGQPSAGVPEHL